MQIGPDFTLAVAAMGRENVAPPSRLSVYVMRHVLVAAMVFGLPEASAPYQANATLPARAVTHGNIAVLDPADTV